MDNVRTPERLGRVGKTPERHQQQQQKVSPFKRDLRINTRFEREKENVVPGVYMSNRSPIGGRKPVSPLSRR